MVLVDISENMKLRKAYQKTSRVINFLRLYHNVTSDGKYVADHLSLNDVNVRVFHTDLSNAEQQKLIHEFGVSFNEIMILACSYYVSCAESNFQTLCHNCHFVQHFHRIYSSCG